MLLREIERHLRSRRISATRFGSESVRDPMLVHDLRRGREPGAKLSARVAAYIAGTTP